MCKPPVLTKRDFVQRYASGEFGNASPTWLDVEKFVLEADPSPLYHLRNGSVAGGTTYYKQTYRQAVDLWTSVAHPQDWYCSMQIPQHVEERLLIQGEVIASEKGGLDLFYSTVKKPMRTALAEQARRATGVRATLLLRHYLCPNSLEWLYVLLRRYRDHVVEFSTYSTKWGTLPNYNTVFWETRLY